MHKLLLRKQQPDESLQQFWHSLNGLASRCELGENTQTLVHDVFILNMNNKKGQMNLCVQPYENPQDVLQNVDSYEEGVKRQKSMGVGEAKCSKVAIKNEPVYAVDRVNKIECFRGGAGNFTIEHMKRCTATNHKCEYFDIMGQSEKCGNKKHPKESKRNKQRRTGEEGNQEIPTYRKTQKN